MRTTPFIQTAGKPVISGRSIDDKKPLKAIFIGAGVSGIIAGIKLPQYTQNLDIVIYDKNPEIGGTWWENRYPGCACDIPAHSYQLSFESNPSWSKFYASSQEILEYWKTVTDKHDLRKYMKLGIKALEANWDEESAKWTVRLENIQTGEIFEDVADALLTGIGVLNEWKWPDVPGLGDFQGKLMHSADWDSDYDYRDQRVAVIGGGSSGIQIVPSIQPDVRHLDHYVRGRTWIAASFGSKFVREHNNGLDGNFSYTPEEIAGWKSDPEAYLKYRRALEEDMQSVFSLTQQGSPLQNAAQKLFEKMMRRRLTEKPEIIENMIPTFAPGCRRLTPGPGYLEALGKENVTVVGTEIQQVTATGVTTSDGVHRPVDVLVCATGFDTSFLKRFPIRGRKGIALTEQWVTQRRHSSYLSVTTNNFPNFFMCLGPNSGVGNGSLIIMLERYVTYAAQCLAKIQNENIRTIVPKEDAVEAFTEFCHAYFEKTVFSGDCSSWYKTAYPAPFKPAESSLHNVNGNDNDNYRGYDEDGREPQVRVSALWPGSSLHAVKALAKPRWEDFEYTYTNENQFGWFGDGWTRGDREAERGYIIGNAELSYYLQGEALFPR